MRYSRSAMFVSRPTRTKPGMAALTALVVIAGVLLAALPAMAQGGGQAEPPVAELRQRIEKELADYYGAAWNESDPAKRRALAYQLFRDARGADSEAKRYVLLRQAKAMAESAGDASTALQALHQLESGWKVPEELSDRAGLIRTALTAAREPEQYERIVRSGLGAIGTLLNRGDYREASALASALRSGAVRARDRDLIAAATEMQQETRQILGAYRRVEASMQTLQESPGDKEANLEVGRFYAFQLGQWEQALPHLAKSGETDLAELAKADLAEPTDAVEQKKLGDRYWSLGEARGGTEGRQLRERARHWYKLALTRLSGNDRELVMRRAASPEAIHWAGRVYNPGLEIAYKQGDVTVSRVVKTLDLDWGTSAPAPGLNGTEHFLITITGRLRAPEEGRYQFQVAAKGQIQVSINDNLLLSGWTGGNTFSAWLYEGLNEVEIVQNVYTHRGRRAFSLQWSPPGAGGFQSIDPSNLYHLLGDSPK